MRLLTFSYLVIALCSFAAVPGNGQLRSGTVVEVTSPEAFSKIGAACWASGGAGVASFGSVDAPLVNPATLQFDNRRIYIEGARRFSTRYLGGFEFDGQMMLPEYGLYGFSTRDFNFALAYARVSDLALSLSIPVTTENFPDGTGQFDDFRRDVEVHSLFASAAKFVSADLSVGVTAGLQYLHYKEELFQVSAAGSGWGAQFIVGAALRPSDNVNLGAALSCGSAINSSVHYNGVSLIDSTRPGMYYALPESYLFRQQFPWTANVGAAWNISPSFELLLDFKYLHWTHINDSWRNTFEVHLGTAYRPSDVVVLRVGFFTQDSPSENPFYNSSQVFLTGGIEFRTSDRFTFTTNILDSHLLSNSTNFMSDGKFRQSSVAVGVEYSLPNR